LKYLWILIIMTPGTQPQTHYKYRTEASFHFYECKYCKTRMWKIFLLILPLFFSFLSIFVKFILFKKLLRAAAELIDVKWNCLKICYKTQSSAKAWNLKMNFKIEKFTLTNI
jgi:hypothetical protein